MIGLDSQQLAASSVQGKAASSMVTSSVRAGASVNGVSLTGAQAKETATRVSKANRDLTDFMILLYFWLRDILLVQTKSSLHCICYKNDRILITFL